jgi:hypothetical protein
MAGSQNARQCQGFDRSMVSASQARHFVEDVLVEHAGAINTEAAVLLANELVINAIVHSSGSQFDLEVAYSEGRVRVGVTDATRPLLQSPLPQALRGRGLLLVDRFAEGWGVEHPRGMGKCVWFELDSQTPRSTI